MHNFSGAVRKMEMPFSEELLVMKPRFIIMTPCQKYNGMASSVLPCKKKFEVQTSVVSHG
jgi:hypothetical protein